MNLHGLENLHIQITRSKSLQARSTPAGRSFSSFWAVSPAFRNCPQNKKVYAAGHWNSFLDLYIIFLGVQRPLNSLLEKIIILVGIYKQQFQGTIFLMVFDFQGNYKRKKQHYQHWLKGKHKPPKSTRVLDDNFFHRTKLFRFWTEKKPKSRDDRILWWKTSDL